MHTRLVRLLQEDGYAFAMSYLTAEVEIEHGRVVPKGSEKLPEKASGLLTILEPASAESATMTPLQALEKLQSHLQLDPRQAAEWMAAVREARR